MGLTARENFMNYITGKPFEWFPNAATDYDGPFLISGVDERSPDNQTGKDWYGCDWIYDPLNGACAIDVTKPYVLNDITEWREKMIWPDLDKIDWNWAAAKDGVDNYSSSRVTYMMLQEGPFERLHSLMPFEDALMAMLEEPEEVEALFDRIVEIKCATMEKLKEYWGCDVVCFHDDWGSQLNLFFAPDIWEDLLAPQIKKCIDKCHELGMAFEMHTCGKVDKILPRLAELGADGCQIMGINDPAISKAVTGDKMSYAVSIQDQTFAAMNGAGSLTEETVRQMVDEEVARWAPGGRFFSYMVPFGDWYIEVGSDELKKLSRQLLGKCYEDQ